jgi:hypothetical protein
MRAFRPSHFSREQDRQEDVERIKLQNVLLYAKRAQAGLPLFSSPLAPKEHLLRSLFGPA